MIRLFLNYQSRKIINNPPNLNDIKKSNKILFAIFTRYGDTIIDLTVIKEFINIYPKKEYLILCPRQMEPYVNEILPKINCFPLNKRNFFDLYKIIKYLKKNQFDIGFNPWSNGIDSCYYLTFTKKYLCFKDFVKPELINHYDVVRQYLNCPRREWKINDFSLNNNYKNILICPQSTDDDRSITAKQLSNIVSELNAKYADVSITIAAMNKSYFTTKEKSFIFNKSKDSSSQFIETIKKKDLIICSDSGPLHIATVLNKPVIAYFRNTNPEIVINTNTKVKLEFL